MRTQFHVAAPPEWPLEEWLERQTRELRRAVLEWGCRIFPFLATAAFGIPAESLAAGEPPHLFSQNLRQIPPTRNEELLDLFGRADQTLANRFNFFEWDGTLEPDFDWEAAPNPACRAELHAFDYALDLAMVWRISRETRYAQHLRYLLAHWIACNPPGQGSGWHLAPLARRLRNWFLASDLARDDWQADATFSEMVTRSLALQSVYLSSQAASEGYPSDNLIAAQALLLAGRYFSGAHARDFARQGWAILREALSTSSSESGEYAEARPAEQLRLASAATEALTFHHAEGTEETQFLRDATRRALMCLEGMLLPDATLPRFGTTARGAAEEISELFALAAVLFEEPAWKSLAADFAVRPYLLLGEDGKRRFELLPAIPWLDHAESKRAAGLLRLVGTENSALAINARPVRSHEDHQDFLSYALFVGGHRLVVDSGAYLVGARAEDYFSSAQAHNTLLLDDAPPDYRPASRAIPEPAWLAGPNWSGVRLSDPGFDARGVARDRAWFCLECGAWVVLDWLRGEETHRVLELIHFYPTYELELRETFALARSRAFTRHVVPLGSPLPALKPGRGAETTLAGFYSPEFGVKYDASVLGLLWEATPLPWLGGYLIAAGDAHSVHRVEINAQAGALELHLAGRLFRLLLSY